MAVNDAADYLPLSGIQHFAFCRRRWALIHVEQLWQENALTAEGRIQHEVAHDEGRAESRGNLVITRGMRVLSHSLRLQGSCDVVEFRRGEAGIPLKGREGLWQPYPVEYKHGSRGIGSEADQLQLCCQALCLEEMLVCPVPQGAIFYQSTRRRDLVDITPALREQARAMAREMNEYYDRGFTPRVRRKAGCKSCSLQDLCLPALLQRAPVSVYIQDALEEVGKAAGEPG